ncbi:MAG: hypothetical protein Q8R14_02235 [Candidatus Omnitrophota bacterium]|nr:hypothetical protein [Candidatus Omnitrophota bacterium]
MSLVDLIVACLIIAIMVVSSSAILEYTKDKLVDSENYYEATKFSMATLEELRPLDYTDPALDITPPDQRHAADLPFPCNLRDRYSGNRSYVVSEQNWDVASSYKEIIVATSWVYKGQNKSVSLGVVKRQ